MSDKEKVAQWMIQKGYATGHGDTVEDLLKELEWQILENWHRAMVNGIKTERKRIVNLFMIQHEAAKGAHNYWQVAANLVQADQGLNSGD